VIRCCAGPVPTAAEVTAHEDGDAPCWRPFAVWLQVCPWLLLAVLVARPPDPVLLAVCAPAVLSVVAWLLGASLHARGVAHRHRLAARQVELGRPLTPAEVWTLME
jgi:hypothetical protein